MEAKGEEKNYIKNLEDMLVKGNDYMEDLVTALVDLDKVQKYADIDKDKFYDVEAKNVRMHDFAPNQNNTSTQALPKKPDTSIENSGIGGQKSGIKWSASTELPYF